MANELHQIMNCLIFFSGTILLRHELTLNYKE